MAGSPGRRSHTATGSIRSKTVDESSLRYTPSTYTHFATAGKCSSQFVASGVYNNVSPSRSAMETSTLGKTKSRSGKSSSNEL